MKRLKLVLLTALLTIGLASCGSGDGDNSCANKTDTTNTTQQATTTTGTTETECSLQSATPSPVVGVTVHDNELLFHPDPRSQTSYLRTVGFDWDNGYSITSGQPWEGLNVNTYNYNGQTKSYIDVVAKAGRKGSNTPKDWFNARNGGVKICDIDWNNIDSLNFAYSGHLVIDNNRYLVVIGQEGYALDNGWWIAGQGPGWTHKTFRPTGGRERNYIVTPDKKWLIGYPTEDIGGFGVLPNN